MGVRISKSDMTIDIPRIDVSRFGRAVGRAESNIRYANSILQGARKMLHEDYLRPPAQDYENAKGFYLKAREDLERASKLLDKATPEQRARYQQSQTAAGAFVDSMIKEGVALGSDYIVSAQMNIRNGDKATTPADKWKAYQNAGFAVQDGLNNLRPFKGLVGAAEGSSISGLSDVDTKS